MSAPAEMARWLTNAIVRTARLEKRVAHHYRRVDPAAEGVDVEHHGRGARLSASRIVRDKNGARPRSIMPSIGTT